MASAGREDYLFRTNEITHLEDERSFFSIIDVDGTGHNGGERKE